MRTDSHSVSEVCAVILTTIGAKPGKEEYLMSKLDFEVVGKAEPHQSSSKPPPGGLQFEVVGPVKGQMTSKRKLVIGLVAALVLIGIVVAAVLLLKEEPPYMAYQGTWKHGNEVIKIQIMPDKDVPATRNFNKKTNLVIPIRISGMENANYRQLTKEGIYEFPDGEQAILSYCTHCNQIVLLGIRMQDGNLQIGVAKKAGIFSHAGYKGHKSLRWITYEKVPETAE